MKTTTIASVRASERGFSLPELLVAMALTLIVPGGVFTALQETAQATGWR